jgi:hypothetical protein
VYYKGNKKREFSKKAKTKENHLNPINHKGFFVSSEEVEKTVFIESSTPQNENILINSTGDQLNQAPHVEQELPESKKDTKEITKNNKKTTSVQRKKNSFSSQIKRNKNSTAPQQADTFHQQNIHQTESMMAAKNSPDTANGALKEELVPQSNTILLHSPTIINDDTKKNQHNADPSVPKNTSTKKNRPKSFKAKNSQKPKKDATNNEAT